MFGMDASADTIPGRGTGMTDELKPCPFCGKKPKIKKAVYGGIYVTCTNIDCYAVVSTRMEYSRYAAIAAWNRREGGQDEQN